MHRKFISILSALMFCGCVCVSADPRYLSDGWFFHLGEVGDGASVAMCDSGWQSVSVPHDWAITGPFDKENDLQVVKIIQNGEKVPSEHSGRTGALPWVGVGWYRTTLVQPSDSLHKVLLRFGGAMSHAQVYVNGQVVGKWNYGYSPFEFEISKFLHTDETPNVIAVRLENAARSSRWYPGAGLYRPVTLEVVPVCRLATGGIFVRTSSLDTQCAELSVSTEVEDYPDPIRVVVRQQVIAPNGKIVAEGDGILGQNATAETLMKVYAPLCWTPDTPYLYKLKTSLYCSGTLMDSRVTSFGIRTVRMDNERGFLLNDKPVRFKGVCLHHDLGPLGAAENRSALLRQLLLLKDLGCNAIRTAHNTPSEWQMELCDSVGLMVMAESFDEWQKTKCKFGYHLDYKEWWSKDLEALIRTHRNHPSIVMWSIGNEIPDQREKLGLVNTRRMQNYCHELDPSRPVTQGINSPLQAIASGVLWEMDVVALNYNLKYYELAHQKSRNGWILGAETASCVTSRGVYRFPAVERKDACEPDGQCSGFALESCFWSNTSEETWHYLDDNAWTLGEFVWTGQDYLGEPTPYDAYWPSRSSYFGMLDLSGLPKDVYYLYRSRWNEESPTLHILPHWTWPGKEGTIVPVHCFTSYPSAELFVNGVSQGRRTKDAGNREERYRLRWDNVVYAPGEIKVVAYDEAGAQVDVQCLKTSGAPHHIVLETDRSCLRAGSQDLAFVTVRVVDKDGNLCPDYDGTLQFKVKGAARFKAVCNGDPTSLEPFQNPSMRAFHGQLVVLVEGISCGKAQLTVSGVDLKKTTENFVISN